MADINPVIRHLLLCDDVRPDPDHPEKLNIYGLFSRITSQLTLAYPLRHPEMCVLLQFANGRGSGEAKIVVRAADTGEVVFTSRAHRLVLPADPLGILGATFRLKDCPLPRAGLYWVEFMWKERELAQEPLELR